MYRVMIIDDEPTARKLLARTIDWKANNMEIVGEAANGIEAINVIDELQPDLAFVDISMPFMDGIKFTEIAQERYPNLVIVILTAFDEFENARKCLKLQVLDYILKPFAKEEIEEALGRAMKRLEEAAYRKSLEEKAHRPIPEAEQSSVDKIKEYLDVHYMDSTINLTSVSQKFGFNPSYLSRKFKQDTGVSFVEYLMNRRMERAVELAKANIKMFCAAGEVGIPDPNYFGRCFKKYVGQSYSEFAQDEKH